MTAKWRIRLTAQHGQKHLRQAPRKTPFNRALSSQSAPTFCVLPHKPFHGLWGLFFFVLLNFFDYSFSYSTSTNGTFFMFLSHFYPPLCCVVLNKVGQQVIFPAVLRHTPVIRLESGVCFNLW
jgi:hypothetical protein